MLWSFAYFFCLLASYYILRPLRDEMGVAGGVRNLHWLFTATFLVMLAAVPVFGAVVAPGGSCQLSVHVTGTAPGPKDGATGAVTSAEAGTGAPAVASLVVLAPPRLAMAFGIDELQLDAITQLTFALTNPNATAALTGVGFTDQLPAGLVIASPTGLTASCRGEITANPGALLVPEGFHRSAP